MHESKPGCQCNCNSTDKGGILIFACSGSADVGAIADQAARQLSLAGVGKMFCLAGIGGRIESMIKHTREASAVLAIDGCPLSCAKKCLEAAGIDNFQHLQLADLGMKKGESPANQENIAKIVASGRKMI